jgi:UDP-3-O-[3-hydroxymyristoyl] N-acetylglucosamine deacetylase
VQALSHPDSLKSQFRNTRLAPAAPPAPTLIAATPIAADFVARSRQRTLASRIDCRGIGLHSGRRVSMALAPALPDTGIILHRTDTGIGLRARYDQVRDSTLSTVLGPGSDPAGRIGTVEHLMAALSAAGIDNAIVSLDGPEVPAMDGSAAPFSFLIACAGVADQDAPLSMIEILRPVRVQDGEASAALLPAHPRTAATLTLSMQISFASAAIGHQERSIALSPESFATQIAPARTFGFAEDLDRLRAAGLARGGSLANAVAISGDHVLNPEGLRFADEFVRHKLLDAIGDLALAGLPIRGRFVGQRSGHRMNNALLRVLFATPESFRIVAAAPRSPARLAPAAEPELAAAAA